MTRVLKPSVLSAAPLPLSFCDKEMNQREKMANVQNSDRDAPMFVIYRTRSCAWVAGLSLLK